MWITPNATVCLINVTNSYVLVSELALKNIFSKNRNIAIRFVKSTISSPFHFLLQLFSPTICNFLRESEWEREWDWVAHSTFFAHDNGFPLLSALLLTFPFPAIDWKRRASWQHWLTDWRPLDLSSALLRCRSTSGSWVSKRAWRFRSALNAGS